ncbi:hypothetical protein JZ751_019107 [Albula glossodonta]|uniref:LIM zinc-binding domain-containing protein n=1 Tax=Albula glossodonta TaxID=121402 RepID=A0A8T2NVH4_9TELE|nr:hypothetical protein JZ751_019107 [Albula glossodonta]
MPFGLVVVTPATLLSKNTGPVWHAGPGARPPGVGSWQVKPQQCVVAANGAPLMCLAETAPASLARSAGISAVAPAKKKKNETRNTKEGKRLLEQKTFERCHSTSPIPNNNIYSPPVQDNVEEKRSCACCGENVVGEGSGCTAMEQVFHVRCFVCITCSAQLSGQPFYAVEKKPYCEPCYIREALCPKESFCFV